MIERNVSMVSSLEARPAALFVQTASRFSSQIHVKMGNKTANAKSIMGLISLGVLDGQVLTLAADGADEEQAINELERFLRAI